MNCKHEFTVIESDGIILEVCVKCGYIKSETYELVTSPTDNIPERLWRYINPSKKNDELFRLIPKRYRKLVSEIADIILNNKVALGYRRMTHRVAIATAFYIVSNLIAGRTYLRSISKKLSVNQGRISTLISRIRNSSKVKKNIIQTLMRSAKPEEFEINGFSLSLFF